VKVLDGALVGTQGQIMAAPYTVVGDAFRAETPQIWSPTSGRQIAVYRAGRHIRVPEAAARASCSYVRALAFRRAVRLL